MAALLCSARHRVPDVTARLVELDDRSVAIAAGRAAELDPSRIEVMEVDAGLTDAYAGIAPATIVLACGVFGNISDTDIETTVTPCRPCAAPERP